jgi:hypothetical protein
MTAVDSRHVDAGALVDFILDELTDRLAERVAERIETVSVERGGSAWLTTPHAVAYSGLPESTFRKLAASGKIPSHGGRTKLFYRPEFDRALLDFSGAADEARELRRIR